MWKKLILLLLFIPFFSCEQSEKEEVVPEGAAKVVTSEVTEITINNAQSGGEVTDEGGSKVFARGLCWNTSGKPIIDDFTSTNGSGLGIFTAEITGLEANVKFYVRAYATNSAGIAYGNEISFTPTYSVGGTGPAGGLIFYDKGNNDGGWRYMEAAPSGWYGAQGDPELSWGCSGETIGNTTSEIGKGKENTVAILSKCSLVNTAANRCSEYSVNANGKTFDDWFLPSLDEMKIMNDNLHAKGLGGFANQKHYWTSSEVNNESTSTQMMLTANAPQDKGFKSFGYKVRPARRF